MNIEHMREFIVIAASESLLRASQKLYLSPSTLSKHLAALEKDLGATLVARTKTSFNLTSVGERYLEYAIAIVREYERALEIPLEPETKYPRVCVGGHLQCSLPYRLMQETSSYAAHHARPVIITPCYQHYTSSILTSTKNDPLRDLAAGLCDVALLFVSEKTDLEGFESISIGSERYSLAVGTEHPLVREDGQIRPEQMAGQRIIVSRAYPQIWERLNEQFASRNVNAIIPEKVVFSSASEMFTSLSGNEAILVLRQDASRIAPPNISGLVVKDIEDSTAIEALAVWKSGSKNEGIHCFMECLRDVLDLHA